MTRYTNYDIEVHLSDPTRGMETDGVDVEASGQKAAELLTDALRAAFSSHSATVFYLSQSGETTITECPDDVDEAAIKQVINDTLMDPALMAEWVVDAAPAPTYTSLHDAIASEDRAVADAGDPADGYRVHVWAHEEEQRIPAASADDVDEWYPADGYTLAVTKEGMPAHFSRFFAEPGALTAIEAYLAAGEVLGQTSFTWRADGE